MHSLRRPTIARISVNVFNHASTSFGDVAWTGQSTRHIREGMEAVLTQDELRRVWMCISPIVYFDKFERWPQEVADDLWPIRPDVPA